MAILRELAIAGAAAHAKLAAAGVDTGFERRGLLNVYGTRRALGAAARAAELDRGDGLDAEVLDGAALARAFPVVTGTPAGAVFYPGEAHCDPLRFVRDRGRLPRAVRRDRRRGGRVEPAPRRELPGWVPVEAGKGDRAAHRPPRGGAAHRRAASPRPRPAATRPLRPLLAQGAGPVEIDELARR